MQMKQKVQIVTLLVKANVDLTDLRILFRNKTQGFRNRSVISKNIELLALISYGGQNVCLVETLSEIYFRKK